MLFALFGGVAKFTWLVASAVVCYMGSIIFTIVTQRLHYPPSMATMGCGLFGAMWLVLFLVILFAHLVLTTLPIWFIGLLVAAVIVLLVISRNNKASA